MRRLLIFALSLSSTLSFAQWTAYSHWGLYESVDFADNTTCFSVGASGAPGNPGIIDKSTDGGITFSNILTDINKAFNDVEFLNANYGFACGTTGGSALFSRTTDGGVTWSDVVIPSGESVQRIQFLDNLHGFAVGGMSETEVWKTIDGGLSWSLIYAPPNSDPFLDMSFTDTLNGFAVTNVSGIGSVFKTTDGGVTWNTLNPAPAGTVGYTSVEHKNFFQLIVTASNGDIYRTNDAGLTWNSCVNTDPNNSIYTDIYFVNGAFGFICGYYGGSSVILRTTNGGNTWNVSYSAATPLILYKIAGVQNTLVVVGLDHCHTTNLGGGLSNYVTGCISGFDTICSGDPTTLRVDFTGTPPWHMTTNPATQTFTGISSTPFFFTVSPTANTTYTIGTFGDAVVSSSSYKSGQGIIQLQPPPAAATSGNTVICSGDTGYIPVTLVGCSPFVLTYNNGTTNTVLNNVSGSALLIPVTPTITTTYSIVSVVDANGNSGTVNGTYTIQVGNPSATVTGSATICQGDPVLLPAVLNGSFPMTVLVYDGNDTLQFTNITNAQDLVVVPALTTTYSLISAGNSCGTVPASGSFTVGVLPSAPAPLQPTAVTVPYNSIMLSWIDISGNETSFVVQRSLNAAGPFTDIISLPPNTVSFLDTGLTIDTRYYYRIKTECAGGCERFTTVVSDSVMGPVWFSFVFSTGGSQPGSRELAWADFNNDGYDDLWFKYNVYMNNGNNTFSPITLAVNGPGTYSSVGDYNNDGFADIFITGGTLGMKFFLNNNGAGFTDFTIQAGLTSSTIANATMPVDEDNDGFLDIIYQDAGSDIVLLHNNGDTTFTLQTACPICYADEGPAAMLDIDNDYDLDFITQSGRRIYLHRKTGSSFTTEQIFMTAQQFDYVSAVTFRDITGDGAPEMFVGAEMHLPLTPLYLNDGNGYFTQVIPWGNVIQHATNDVNTCDVMNDGWSDMFYAESPLDPVLYLMDSLNYTVAQIDSLSWNNNLTDCSVWADTDRDGDEDVFMNGGTANTYPGLFMNHGNYSGSYFEVQCVGVISNRMAYGAKVELLCTIDGISRWQYRAIQSQTGVGMSSVIAHFGVGDATNIDSVIIHWPSGIVTYAVNLQVNQRTVMYEILPACAYQPDSILAIGTSSATVDITWAPLCAPPLFDVVERAPAFAGPYAIEDTIINSATQYLSTGLQPLTIYYYRIQHYYPNNVIVTSYIDSAITLPSCDSLAVFVNSDSVMCQGETIHLVAPSGFQYQWYMNNVAISGATNDYLDVQIPGDYRFEMLTPAGCTAHSPGLSIQLQTVQTATITSLDGDTTCSLQPVRLTWSYPASLDVAWSHQFIPTGNTNDTLIVSQAGTYTFCGYDIAGCPVNSAPLTIYSFNGMNITTPGPHINCPGVPELLNAVQAANVTYQWLLNSAPIAGANSNQYSATSAGNYQLVCSTPIGCVDTSAIISLAFFPVDSTVIFTLPDTVLCTDDSFMSLSALPAGGTFSGVGVSQNVFYPDQVTPGIITLYYSVNDSNGCQITQPCTITVSPCTGLEEQYSGGEVIVKENPFSDAIHLTTEIDATFTLYNHLGQVVLTGAITKGVNTISATSLSTGMYFMHVMGSDIDISIRLLKQ